MPILANITYGQSPTFNLQRQYMWGFVFQWWHGFNVIQSGNPFVFEETLFGGYRTVIKFKDWWWQWDNRAANLDYVLEDLYALPPGGGSPINAGDILIQYDFDTGFLVPTIELITGAPGGDYIWYRFPPQNRPYWNPLVDNAPPTPFRT